MTGRCLPAGTIFIFFVHTNFLVPALKWDWRMAAKGEALDDGGQTNGFHFHIHRCPFHSRRKMSTTTTIDPLEN